MNIIAKPFAVASLVLATAMTPAIVAAEDASEIKALTEAKISLTQAIDAAEKHQGGKALDASIDDDSFSPTFEVSVVKDGKVFDVRVDGVKGTVIGAREDLED